MSFSEDSRDEIRPHLVSIVIRYVALSAWRWLSDPEDYPLERLAASLGLLLNTQLKFMGDEKYEAAMRDDLASIESTRDLVIYLTGFLRAKLDSFVFLAGPLDGSSGERSQRSGADLIHAHGALRDVIAAIGSGKGRRTPRRKRRKTQSHATAMS